MKEATSTFNEVGISCSFKDCCSVDFAASAPATPTVPPGVAAPARLVSGLMPPRPILGGAAAEVVAVGAAVRAVAVATGMAVVVAVEAGATAEEGKANPTPTG